MTRRVTAGNVAIGGGAPVTVQTMTNTDTRSQLELLQTRFEALKASAASYKADYGKLLEKVNAVLNESNDLF